MMYSNEDSNNRRLKVHTSSPCQRPGSWIMDASRLSSMFSIASLHTLASQSEHASGAKIASESSIGHDGPPFSWADGSLARMERAAEGFKEGLILMFRQGLYLCKDRLAFFRRHNRSQEHVQILRTQSCLAIALRCQVPAAPVEGRAS